MECRQCWIQVILTDGDVSTWRLCSTAAISPASWNTSITLHSWSLLVQITYWQNAWNDVWMLRQMQGSMLHQALHVLIASKKQKIQSSDWSKWCVRYDVTKFPAFCLTEHHFRLSNKLVVDTSSVKENWKLITITTHIFNVNKTCTCNTNKNNSHVWFLLPSPSDIS